MTKEDHARILYAYIARISLSDMRKLLEAKEVAYYDTLNCGNRAQLASQKAMQETVGEALANMILYDRQLIEKIIKEVVKP